MTEKLTDDLKTLLADTLRGGMTEESLKSFRKQLRDTTIELETSIEYFFIDSLAPVLSDFVEGMAKRTIEAIMQGNESQMRRYLGCERGAWTGRSDSPQFGRRHELHEWHSVIHGRLFETGAVELRRSIVEAHRELVKDERMLDLEDQVRALVAQVNKLTAEKEGLFERLREAQRN